MKSQIRRRTARLLLAVGAGVLAATLTGTPTQASSVDSAAAALASAPAAIVVTGVGAADTVVTENAAVATTAVATNVTASAFTAAPTAVSSRAAKAAKVIALAKQYSGRPYRWSAAGPKRFDCTGYTKFIYKKVGVKLPHSGAQGKKGKKVSRAKALPGDLVIFRDSGGRVYHVGIYAGGNKMYDAPTYGKKTGLHRIWSKKVEFRRVLG
ncbi:cell wall-associated NlpC family hydrolase [Hamadaea flava]|uniref:C40 family peptidase n=1 Tax=Hamadaea flava TaxID=1742688 RepID=A0ABV8LWM7_9ACTN|nr:C40 family peptidase [Hamadaea flava]MCP2327936.1 cell wall-associated NlpC family hydrolase [Hamadaea flava]